MKNLFTLLFVLTLSSVFAQSSLTNDLVAHYSFNGNADDQSGNNFHGYAIGATLTTDRFGNSNYAYQFDGVDDYIICNSILDISTQSSITISAWFYPQQINNNNILSGIGFGKKTTGALVMRVRMQSDNRFQSHHASALEKSAIGMKADSLFSYNNWYHLVAIYSDNDVQLYVNNVLQSSPTGPGNTLSTIPSNSIFRIGQAFHDNNMETFYFGKIDDIRIYNRTLSLVEIDSLYIEANPTLGINYLDIKPSVEIYPNPFTEYLNISNFRDEIITITDLYGKTIYTIRQVGDFKIETTNWNPGIYFIIRGSTVKKVIRF